MSVPRAVRIPRAYPARGRTSSDLSLPPIEVRPNRGGGQRALRIAVVYVGAISLLTAILLVLGLAGPDAAHPGVQQGLELFVGVAGLLALGSVIYAFSPAPRKVEVRSDAVVVVGRWGRRRRFGALSSLAVQVVRHFPAGALSPRPVDAVRVVDSSGRPATYEVESGIFGPDWTPD